MTILVASRDNRGRQRMTTEFQLDRLFGLALTDARFFRQLREHPKQAAARFELTEPEMRAIVNIAPAIRSIEDLALRLDSWMTSDAPSAVPAFAEEPLAEYEYAVPRSSPASDMFLSMR